MSAVDDLQALTTSIGEFTVETLGRDTIEALRVTMERAENRGHISIVLRDNSDAEQKRVLTALFEIEQIYFDDAALSFAFVEDLDSVDADMPSVPVYSFA